jgi:hypothetical protein
MTTASLPRSLCQKGSGADRIIPIDAAHRYLATSLLLTLKEPHKLVYVGHIDMAIIVQVVASALLRDSFHRSAKAGNQRIAHTPTEGTRAFADSAPASIVRGAGIAVLAGRAIFEWMGLAGGQILVAHSGVALVASEAAIA